LEKPYAKNKDKFTIPVSVQKEMIKFFQRVFTQKNAKDSISQQQPQNKKAEVVKHD